MIIDHNTNALNHLLSKAILSCEMLMNADATNVMRQACGGR